MTKAPKGPPGIQPLGGGASAGQLRTVIHEVADARDAYEDAEEGDEQAYLRLSEAVDRAVALALRGVPPAGP